MAVSGNRCGTPEESKQSSSVIGEIANKVRTGVIPNSGVLGVKAKGGIPCVPRVKTVSGGSMWVIRTLTQAEGLACWDVPEKLGQLAETQEQK
jgi:hypothetical protein